MVIFPLLVGVVALAIGLDPLATMIAIIFGVVPSAASAYTLARQMGGDGPTMAAIVTIQTATSFVTLALTLMLAQHWLAI
jgi:malonate transporter